MAAMLAEVDGQKCDPECLVQIAVAMMQDCRALWIEEIVVRIGSSNIDRALSQHRCILESPHTRDHLPGERFAAWARSYSGQGAAVPRMSPKCI